VALEVVPAWPLEDRPAAPPLLVRAARQGRVSVTLGFDGEPTALTRLGRQMLSALHPRSYPISGGYWDELAHHAQAVLGVPPAYHVDLAAGSRANCRVEAGAG
jgi:hypothetical protein